MVIQIYLDFCNETKQKKKRTPLNKTLSINNENMTSREPKKEWRNRIEWGDKEMYREIKQNVEKKKGIE